MQRSGGDGGSRSRESFARKRKRRRCVGLYFVGAALTHSGISTTSTAPQPHASQQLAFDETGAFRPDALPKKPSETAPQQEDKDKKSYDDLVSSLRQRHERRKKVPQNMLHEMFRTAHVNNGKSYAVRPSFPVDCKCGSAAHLAAYPRTGVKYDLFGLKVVFEYLFRSKRPLKEWIYGDYWKRWKLGRPHVMMSDPVPAPRTGLLHVSLDPKIVFEDKEAERKQFHAVEGLEYTEEDFPYTEEDFPFSEFRGILLERDLSFLTPTQHELLERAVYKLLNKNLVISSESALEMIEIFFSIGRAAGNDLYDMFHGLQAIAHECLPVAYLKLMVSLVKLQEEIQFRVSKLKDVFQSFPPSHVLLFGDLLPEVMQCFPGGEGFSEEIAEEDLARSDGEGVGIGPPPRSRAGGGGGRGGEMKMSTKSAEHYLNREYPPTIHAPPALVSETADATTGKVQKTAPVFYERAFFFFWDTSLHAKNVYAGFWSFFGNQWRKDRLWQPAYDFYQCTGYDGFQSILQDEVLRDGFLREFLRVKQDSAGEITEDEAVRKAADDAAILQKVEEVKLLEKIAAWPEEKNVVDEKELHIIGHPHDLVLDAGAVSAQLSSSEDTSTATWLWPARNRVRLMPQAPDTARARALLRKSASALPPEATEAEVGPPSEDGKSRVSVSYNDDPGPPHNIAKPCELLRVKTGRGLDFGLQQTADGHNFNMHAVPHANCFALMTRLNGDTLLTYKHERFLDKNATTLGEDLHESQLGKEEVQKLEDEKMRQLHEAPWKCWVFRCWDGVVRVDPEAAVNKDPLLRQNVLHAGVEQESVVIQYPIPEAMVAHKRQVARRVAETLRRGLVLGNSDAGGAGGVHDPSAETFAAPEDELLPEMLRELQSGTGEGVGRGEIHVGLKNFDLYSRLCHPIRSLVDVMLSYRPNLNGFYPFYDPKTAADPGDSWTQDRGLGAQGRDVLSAEREELQSGTAEAGEHFYRDNFGGEAGGSSGGGSVAEAHEQEAEKGAGGDEWAAFEDDSSYCKEEVVEYRNDGNPAESAKDGALGEDEDDHDRDSVAITSSGAETSSDHESDTDDSQTVACLAPIVYGQEEQIMANQSNFIAPYCDEFIFFAANRSAPEFFNGYRVHNLDIISDEWQSPYRSPNGAEKENAMMLEAYFYYFFPQMWGEESEGEIEEGADEADYMADDGGDDGAGAAVNRIAEFSPGFLGAEFDVGGAGAKGGANEKGDEDDDLWYARRAPEAEHRRASTAGMMLSEEHVQDQAKQLDKMSESLYILADDSNGLLVPYTGEDDSAGQQSRPAADSEIDEDLQWVLWQRQDMLRSFPYHLLGSEEAASKIRTLITSENWFNQKSRLSMTATIRPEKDSTTADATVDLPTHSLVELIGDESVCDKLLRFFCNKDRGSTVPPRSGEGGTRNVISYTEAEDRVILELGFRNVSDPAVLGPISPEHYSKFVLPPSDSTKPISPHSTEICIRHAESRFFARILRDVHRRFRESRTKWYERREFLSGSVDLMFYPKQELSKETGRNFYGYNAHAVRDGYLETEADLFSMYDYLQKQKQAILTSEKWRNVPPSSAAPPSGAARKLDELGVQYVAKPLEKITNTDRRRLKRIQKRQRNILRVLQSKYRGTPEMDKIVAAINAEDLDLRALDAEIRDSRATTTNTKTKRKGNIKAKRMKKKTPDWYCQIESDLYFIPENFERFVKLRNFDPDTPLYLGHIWTTITDKVFGLQRTGFSTEVTQGLCVSRAGLKILAEFYKYFYIGRAEKYKILVAEMENAHKLSINQLLASERVARRTGWTWHGIERKKGEGVENSDVGDSAETTHDEEGKNAGGTAEVVEPEESVRREESQSRFPELHNNDVDTMTDESVLAQYFGSHLYDIPTLDSILNTASTLLEGDLDLARDILNKNDDILERDYLGGQNGDIVQTYQVATRTFSRRMSPGAGSFLLKKTYWFYNSLRFFSVASSQTYLGQMGYASTDGGSKRSHRVSVDSAFGIKAGHQCLPFQSFVWESYMDLNSICLREIAHVHPTMAVQPIQVTHDAKGRMFWGRELDKVAELFLPNPFDELAALPYDYGKKTHDKVAEEYKDSGALEKALSAVGGHFDILWEQRNTFFNRVVAAKVCWKRKVKKLKTKILQGLRAERRGRSRIASSDHSKAHNLLGSAGVSNYAEASGALHEEARNFKREHDTLALDLDQYYEKKRERASTGEAEETDDDFAQSEAERIAYRTTHYYSPFPICFHGHRAEYNEKIKRVFGQKHESGGSTRLYFAYFNKDAIKKKAKIQQDHDDKENEVEQKCRRSGGNGQQASGGTDGEAEKSSDGCATLERQLGELKRILREFEEKRPVPASNSIGSQPSTTNRTVAGSSPSSTTDSKSSVTSNATNSTDYLIDNRDEQDRTKRSRFTLTDVHIIVRGHCQLHTIVDEDGIDIVREKYNDKVREYLGGYRPLVWGVEGCAWPKINAPAEKSKFLVGGAGEGGKKGREESTRDAEKGQAVNFENAQLAAQLFE